MSSLICLIKPSFLFLETVAMSNSKCSQILTSMPMLNFFNLFCWLHSHRLKRSEQIGCFSATSAMIPSCSSCNSVSYCSAWVSLSRSRTSSSIRSAGLCTFFLCAAASLEKNERICCVWRHSLAANKRLPSSSLAHLMSMETCTGSALCPVALPRSNFSWR